MHRSTVEHVPVVRHADHPLGDDHITVIFDAHTGRRIGHSPTHQVEQTIHRTKDGTIKTTLTITRRGRQND